MRDDLDELSRRLWPDLAPLRPRGGRGARAARRGRAVRLATVASAGLVVAGAGGIGALVIRQHAFETSGGTTSSTPAPIGADGTTNGAVVPWVDTPAPDSSRPFTIAGFPACRATALSIRVAVPDPSYIGAGPVNTRFWAVTVSNAGANPCYVPPTLDVAFHSAGGVADPINTTSGLIGDIVYLTPPGEPQLTGFASLAVGEIDTYGSCSQPTTSMDISLPGLGSVALDPGPAGGSGGYPCPGTGSRYAASLRPNTSLGGYAPLVETSIDAPATAQPGEHVRYLVTIRDVPAPRSCIGCPTPLPRVTFNPCPTYHVELEGVSGTFHSYALNCRQAQAIGPGQTETFEMYIDVPNTVAVRPAVLAWSVDGPLGEYQSARSYILIGSITGPAGAA